MYNCQTNLITHLATGFSSPTVRTIKAYAGELRDASKVTEIVPAILVLYDDGEPISQEKYHNFEIIILTESRVLDKVTNQENNLALSSQVAAWLKANPTFLKSGGGTYYVHPEKMHARTGAITDRFAVVLLKTTIEDRT